MHVLTAVLLCILPTLLSPDSPDRFGGISMFLRPKKSFKGESDL